MLPLFLSSCLSHHISQARADCCAQRLERWGGRGRRRVDVGEEWILFKVSGDSRCCCLCKSEVREFWTGAIPLQLISHHLFQSAVFGFSLSVCMYMEAQGQALNLTTQKRAY